MKKIIPVLIAALVIICAFSVGFASESEQAISVQLNGEVLSFDVEPILINDRTMVPMRAIFEALGCKVTWIAEQEVIVASGDNKIISMRIGKPNMPVLDIITEEQTMVTLDSPPIVVNDRTLVPVRAVSEGLNAKVLWQEETQTVVITK